MRKDTRGEQRTWAYRTFGGLRAGNTRRGRRVVDMAAGIAARAAGTVTQVFDDSADREGAYRLLSNDAVTSEALIGAMGESCAAECREHERVFVAVDGSSLGLSDNAGARDIGGVGDWTHGGRGLHVITALALDLAGVPIGVCAQTWWARKHRSPSHVGRRPLATKETRYFVKTVVDAHARLSSEAPQTKAIFLMDRGFDCWPVLELASRSVRMVVRAQYNRRLAPDGDHRYLRDALACAPKRGSFLLDVPARHGRAARRSKIVVRSRRVTLDLPADGRIVQVTMNALEAREVNGPKGDAICWMLLTTESTTKSEEALEMVRAYAMRWRIEEVHRAWKRGGCNVENTQLRSREGLIKWATLHVAVATRSVRLARLSRETPEVPASQEFTQDEIDGAIVLRRRRTKLRMGDVPSLAEVVRLVADLGGYTGKSSGGPPGPTVIARGLERIATAALVIASMREKE